MSNRFHSFFQNVVASLKHFLKQAVSFFKRVFKETINSFKKPSVPISIALFVVAIPLSSGAFYHNVNNTTYGIASYCQNKVLNKESSCIGISFETIISQEKGNYSQWTQIGSRLNSNYYLHSRTGTLMMPIDEKENPIISQGSFHNLPFKTRLSTFFSFLNETKNTDYFASVYLKKYDTSDVGQDFRSYPYEGKDSSSYIPDVLADYIIKNDDSGLFKTYDDLLGAHYSISFKEKNINLSINNIYSTKQLLGPAIKGFVGHPIIMDFKSINELSNFRLFTSCIGDSTGISNLIKHLSLAEDESISVSVSFPKYDGDTSVNQNITELFNKTIVGMKSNSSLSGCNVVLLVLFILCYLGFVSLVVFNLYRYKETIHFFGFGIIILFVVLLALTIVHFINRGLTFFFICNSVTIVTAFATPLLLMTAGAFHLRSEKHE